MDGDPVAALRAAAADGVGFDGLDARLEDGVLALAIDGSETTVDGDLSALEDAFVPFVTNWFYWTEVAPERPSGWAFLRWLEGATGDGERDPSNVLERYDALSDGIERTWGELAITALLAEGGRRRYEVRHVEDRNAAVADLDDVDGPEAADGIARFDDRDRYRPLRTAPTLRTGWVFADLGPDALLSVVGEFYPATVENWHREREGTLDVTHYREAAERQTGRYRSVSALSSDSLAWAVEACCVDSQCLKRRRWDEDGETELDVPRGEGAFPCREPCSLFIAAAREWTDLEGEEPRSDDLELTADEVAQLEAIVDAVADGRVDEIRVGDVANPANRYRVRFLRAKRFGDDRPPSGSEDGP